MDVSDFTSTLKSDYFKVEIKSRSFWTVQSSFALHSEFSISIKTFHIEALRSSSCTIPELCHLRGIPSFFFGQLVLSHAAEILSSRTLQRTSSNPQQPHLLVFPFLPECPLILSPLCRKRLSRHKVGPLLYCMNRLDLIGLFDKLLRI